MATVSQGLENPQRPEHEQDGDRHQEGEDAVVSPGQDYLVAAVAARRRSPYALAAVAAVSFTSGFHASARPS